MDTSTTHRCDIILPIYNGLEYAKECINSIIKHTPKDLYHLYVIDDCCDSVTRQYISSLINKNINITIIHNKTNLGFLKSCNKGMQQNNAEYVLLINSDVIVVESWLTRLLTCADTDTNIASVNPLTNHASQINISIAPGFNFITMDESIRQLTQRKYPDVVTGVGFCMLLRRTALETVGLFDEIYGHGYCEESDLCMRLTTNGYRTVVADDVYVFHKGSASFKNRDERYLKNREIFDARWLSIYKKQFKAFQKEDPLAYLRHLFKAPQRWSPLTSMRETYRTIRTRYRIGDYIGVIKAAVKGALKLPLYTEDIISNKYIDNLSQQKKLRVTYVLHSLTVAGGVFSVVQLVNELILLGVDARIVTLYEYPEIKQWKLYFAPIIFKNKKELINNFPESDIVVATHWSTASWVSNIISAGKAKTSVYFLQDYESWFFPASDIESRATVKDTYTMIEHKIVKSSWLQNMLQTDDFDTKKIWLGMNLDIFYPRDVIKNINPTIIAMARPRTPRRGFNVLIEALSNIKSRFENINIILFGDNLTDHTIPFPHTDMGVIYNQNQLAELYSSSDIFIDASEFQGFGRTALEAMACKTACVLTNVGGVNEYAENNYNCVLIPPQQPLMIADAVINLLNDDKLMSTIIMGGSETVNKFSHKSEAMNTHKYFNKLIL